MPSPPLADVEDDDARPGILRWRERRLGGEGKAIAAPEVQPADDRFERAAQAVCGEIRRTRVDAEPATCVGVRGPPAGQGLDLALDGPRDDDIERLGDGACLVVWSEGVRDGGRNEIALSHRFKAVAVELVELALVLRIF